MKMETLMEEGEEYLSPEESSWNYELDVTQLCRICANPNEYLIPIFEGEGLEHELKSKINKHLPIKVIENDKLPTHLCYQCASTLIAWNDMVVGCLEADEKLKALTQVDKTESDTSKDIEINGTDDCPAPFTDEAQSNTEIESVEVPQSIENAILADVNDVSHELDESTEIGDDKVVFEEEVITIDPGLVEEVSSEPRCDEMEEDYNDEDNYNQINGKNDMYIEAEDDFMSDLESDEEFNTLYSCNICKASNMVIGEFLVHTGKHTGEERRLVLEKLVDSKETEEVAARNAAAAYGFKVQLSLKSSVPLCICTVCGQGNLLLKHLQDHSTLHPQVTESHYCNLCQQQFHTSNKLAVHLEAHLNNNDLICQYCNRRFSIIEDVEQHESTHQQAEYICADCRKNFKSKELILLHLKETHSNGTTCFICDKEFKTESLILKHFMTHASINVVKRIVKMFGCDFCAKKYDSKTSLQRHILFLHNDRMPYICEHCGFTAYHEEPLKEHLAREHYNNDMSICCKCGLFFSTKSSLDEHMATHSEIKLYSCKFCGIMFKSAQKLQFHLSSHGDVGSLVLNTNLIKARNDQQQPSENYLSQFTCSYCDKLFVVKETYLKHLQHHLATIYCDLCNKPFESEMLLNSHMNKVHTSNFYKPDLNKIGVLPFQCNYCAAFFKLEFELEDHIKIHNIVIYQCHFCFQKCDNHEELLVHLRTHDEDTYESVETTESVISDDRTCVENEILGQ